MEVRWLALPPEILVPIYIQVWADVSQLTAHFDQRLIPSKELK